MAVERIIFLCQDNGALSPMAESIFLEMYHGKPIYVASRGMVVLYETPFNPKMETVLASHNLQTVRKETLGIGNDDLTGVTLVVAMTARVKEQFVKSFPNVRCETLAALSGEHADCRLPYGGSVMNFEECFTDISRKIRKMIPNLEELNKGTDGVLHMSELFEQEDGIYRPNN